jgi:hypothetical protein
MRELIQTEVDSVSGGVIAVSGMYGAVSGILWGAAEGAAAFGLEAMIVPGVGTALGGCLEAGAAVMAGAAGVAYLAGH